ncbi:MAG: hypothetical protein ABEJ23_02585 [Haloarculaceae archaeon]
MTTVRVAVPRKGRPLEAVLGRLAARSGTADLADGITSTLRYEKAVTKGNQTPDRGVYDRLAAYSDVTPGEPEFTLLRDARDGMPRRIVFDSVTVPLGDHRVQLVGREEPFRALRKHEFALGFDSADLVLEEVVELQAEPLTALHEVNERIDPRDTDVRLVDGLGDTVHHTLLATPAVAEDLGGIDRAAIAAYQGQFCISPRYERLVEAVLGTDAIEGLTFCYPDAAEEEEVAIAEAGVGAYLTVSGSTAREHGLRVGERLFPSETVLLENPIESGPADEAVADRLVSAVEATTEV